MGSVKKMLIAILLLCIMAFSVTGCFNKQVIVATINGESISEQLYRRYLWSIQRELETIYVNYWNFDNLNGKSPEELLKAKTLESIVISVVAEQKAEELGVNKLTKEDKKTIKEAARKAMQDTKSYAEQYDIKLKDYERYCTFAIQCEKVLQSLAVSYEPNQTEIATKVEELINSGASADEVTITHILFATRNELGEEVPEDKKQALYKEAQSVLERALAGEDMEMLAHSYSDDSLVEYTFTQAEESLGEEIGQVVFEKAEIGVVYPEIIETPFGYEIIKVIDRKSNVREQAIEMIKSDYATNELAQMALFADVQTTEVYDAIAVGPSVKKEEQTESNESK